ncbi:hypothetical protein [Actinotalea fermentans]|uniref:Uncharacterized protein n=1 Tax=Actinotalea fermentans TaxID=43671 RepID=A0A511Z1C6_9CELL|nr:hypothetical protein [Actinotalea fermentans]KGM15067.1 hypothetical protein N867_12370 [Actinotalea fermentans ATCC 43279 = JCM 9966 = DSM 3133]GEN81258.1 hypothetical protein AFE02nite_29920 [Actinotalea fermentans]
MRIEVTVDEAVRLARAARPLPAMVLGVRAAGEAGDAVEVDLDPALLPGASGLLRFGAALAGQVTVTARFLGFADGDATFALAAQARGLTVDRLLNHLTGAIADALAAQGLPPDVVELRPGEDGPVLVAHAQAAVDARATGVVVRGVGLTSGQVAIEVEIGDARLR